MKLQRPLCSAPHTSASQPVVCSPRSCTQDKAKRKALSIREREKRTNSGLQGARDNQVLAAQVPVQKKKRKSKSMFTKLSAIGKFRSSPEARAAMRAKGAPAPGSIVPPAWLEAHRFTLPADAQAQHAQAKAAASVLVHEVIWMQLRRVQAEDEARLQEGKKKRMKWLSTSKHIERTSFSQLSVDGAMAIANLATADQIRLLRHGGWA